MVDFIYLMASRAELLNELISLSQTKKYMLYDRSPDKIDLIMKLLDDSHYSYGDCSFISSTTGIPTSTISDWRKRQRENPNYHPLLKQTTQSKRIFTNEEESYITEYIEENIIKQGLLFQNQDFKNLIMDAYLEKYYYEDDYSKLPKFNVSDGFVTDFKKRNDFVSRKLHAARRPLTTHYDDTFSEQMEYLFKNVEESYIINIDETSWEVIPKILKCWHKKGEDHVIRYVNGDPKNRITVVAGIRADGVKLPLQFIASGKTDYVCESQLGDVNYHFRSFSENGWTTINTFKDYIVGIRDYYGYDDNQTLHVICDSYKVHISEEIIQFSEKTILNCISYLVALLISFSH